MTLGTTTLTSVRLLDILNDVVPNAPVAAEARVRKKSQLTLPESVVHAARVTEGDRFVVEVRPDDTDTIRLHRIRESYAGTLGDLYGDPDAYLHEERATWER